MAGPQQVVYAAPWPPAFSAAFVDHARARLEHRNVLLVVGPSGSDRLTLATSVADGFDGPVWHHRGRLDEHDEPYRTLGRLFPDLDLDPVATTGAMADRARQVLASMPGPAPTIILLDGDLCDEPSLAVLAALGQDRDVRIIAALTPQTVGTTPHLVAVDDQVRLDPLDLSTVRALLQIRFGIDAHPTVVQLLRERSEGTYGILREITETAVGAGMLTVVEGVLVIDPSEMGETARRIARDHASRSIDRLGRGPEVADLLDLTALVGELDVTELETIFSADDVDLVLTHGAVRRTDDAVAFTSRAEAELIDERMTDSRRVELFERYADRLTTSTNRPASAMPSACWWLAVGRPVPARMARHAAHAANRQGRWARTIRFTDPSSVVGGAVVAPVERCWALHEMGHTEEFARVLEALDPETLTEDELFWYLVWTAWDTPPVAGHEDIADRSRAAVATLATLFARAHGESSTALSQRLRALTFSGILSPANQAAAYVGLCISLRQSGQPALAVRAGQAALDVLAEDLHGPSAVAILPAREVHIAALIDALDLDAAEQALMEYSADSSPYARAGRVGTGLWGLLEFRKGNLAQAAANLRLCVDAMNNHDPYQFRGWAEAMLAQVLVQMGRRDEAIELVAQSESHPSTERRQIELERRVSAAATLDALGEPERSLDLIDLTLDDASRHDLMLVRIEAAALGVQVGGPDRLPALLEAVADLTEPSGAPAVWRTFASACRDHDLDELARLAVRLDASRNRVMAAEIAQCTLDLAHSSGVRMTSYSQRRLEDIADPPP